MREGVMDGIAIRRFEPGDAEWIVAQHGALYARDEGFDDTFAPLVERILADFVAGHDPDRERGWVAVRGQTRLGCIFCVRQDEMTAKLRMFLVMPEARGEGLGRRLLQTCMDFARSAGYARMQLWTHESHRAACALYAATGWRMTEARPVRSFGRDLVEQSWEIAL